MQVRQTAARSRSTGFVRKQSERGHIIYCCTEYLIFRIIISLRKGLRILQRRARAVAVNSAQLCARSDECRHLANEIKIVKRCGRGIFGGEN